MQEIQYEESPLIVTTNVSMPQGWNSAHWGPWVQVPANGGVLSGPYWVHAIDYVAPLAATSEAAGSSNTTLWIVIGIVVAVAVIIVLFLVLRRGKRAIEE